MAQPTPDILQRIEALLQAGRQQESRLLLLEYIKSNPASSRAWWLLSQAVVDPSQQMDCLERVLRLDPLNAEALEWLGALQAAQAEERPQAVFTDTPSYYLEEEPYDSAPSSEAAYPSLSTEPASPPSAPIHPRPVPQKSSRGLEAFLGVVFFDLIAVGGVFLWNQYRANAAADQAARAEETQAVALVLAQLPTLTPSPVGTSTVIETVASSATLTATPPPADQFLPQEGYSAPAFNLMDVQSSRWTSLKQFKGQPVVLYFCSTASPECLDEADVVKAIRQKYADQDPVILLVSSGEASAGVNTFQQNHLLNFPVLVDRDNTVKHLYQVESVPAFFFIDPAGRILHVEAGFLTYPQLSEQIKALLP